VCCNANQAGLKTGAQRLQPPVLQIQALSDSNNTTLLKNMQQWAKPYALQHRTRWQLLLHVPLSVSLALEVAAAAGNE